MSHFKGFFRTIPQRKKVRGWVRTRGRNWVRTLIHGLGRLMQSPWRSTTTSLRRSRSRRQRWRRVQRLALQLAFGLCGSAHGSSHRVGPDSRRGSHKMTPTETRILGGPWPCNSTRRPPQKRRKNETSGRREKKKREIMGPPPFKPPPFGPTPLWAPTFSGFGPPPLRPPPLRAKNWPNAVWPNSVNKNWPNSAK